MEPTYRDDDNQPPSADETVAAVPGRERRPGAQAARLQRGDMISRYVVLDELGFGSMGVVYAAYDPELDRKLAIKLLREPHGEPGDASAGTTRLLREAQALAKLNHRNVVTVHDVGTHHGAVFVAMEFVEGATLGRWMADGPHPWREVAQRFVAAGRGLAAAHAAGLIHRDFKPDNVLLGREVLVADFGLARAGESKSTSNDPGTASDEILLAELTATGALMGTPAYMAPEQHLGQTVNARADQFAFCVALYEALFGHRPFAGDSLASLAYQVSAGEMRAPAAGTDVPRWVRRVVLRGLSTEPDDRYPDMAALLDDLDRDPAAQRRRWLAASGIVLAIGLAGAATWRTQDARAAACRGMDEHMAGVWDEPRRDQIAQAFTETGVSYADDTWARVVPVLDSYVSYWVAQRTNLCEATRLRAEQSEELLDRRLACLDRARTELGGLLSAFAEPDRETIDHALAGAQALRPLEGCADADRLLSAAPTPDDPAVAAKVEEIRAKLDHCAGLQAAGRYHQALEQVRAAIEASQGLDYRPLEAETHMRLASTAIKLHDYDTVIEAAQRAFRASLATGQTDIGARAAYHLISAHGTLDGDLEEVRHWAGLASALAERSGSERLEMSIASNYSGSLYALGELEEALVLANRGLELGRRVGGMGSEEEAMMLMNLASMVARSRDLAEASRLSRRAHEIFAAELGVDHPRTTSALNQVAVSAFRRGDYREAEQAMREVLAARERVFGPESIAVAMAQHNLAPVLISLGSFTEALELTGAVLAAHTGFHGPESTQVAETLANQAVVKHKLGRLDAALADATRARDILITKHGNRPRIAAALAIRAMLLRDLGRLDESLADMRLAAEIENTGPGKDSPQRYDILGQLASILVARGEFQDALATVEQALRLAEDAMVQTEHWGVMYLAKAQALAATGGEIDQARKLARDALARFEENPAANRREIEEVRTWLSDHGG